MAPSGRHSIAVAASRTRGAVQELNAEPPGGPGAVPAGPLGPGAVSLLYRTRRGVCPGYRACPVMAAVPGRVLMSGRVIFCSIRCQLGMAFARNDVRAPTDGGPGRRTTCTQDQYGEQRPQWRA